MATLTDGQIIALCHNPTKEDFSDPSCATRVVRITESLLVKFGYFVEIHEFRNQQAAQQRLDASILNVPTLHRFIEREGNGYIVMDYIDGKTLDIESARGMAKELANVLGHINSQGATKPGSLGGGPLSGVLWPEHEEVEFSEPADLQIWFDMHSPKSVTPIDFNRYPLYMCHLNFMPRNIIVKDGRIYLIDWASAGYFPGFFEHAVYRILTSDRSFYKALKPFLPPLSEEQQIVDTVVEISDYSQFRILGVTGQMDLEVANKTPSNSSGAKISKHTYREPGMYS